MQNEETTSIPSANMDMLLNLTETGIFFRGKSILLKDVQPATDTFSAYESQMKVENNLELSMSVDGFEEESQHAPVVDQGGLEEMSEQTTSMPTLQICSSSTVSWDETDGMMLPMDLQELPLLSPTRDEIPTYGAVGVSDGDCFASIKHCTKTILDLKVILKQREIQYPKDLDYDDMDNAFTIMETISEVDEDIEQLE